MAITIAGERRGAKVPDFWSRHHRRGRSGREQRQGRRPRGRSLVAHRLRRLLRSLQNTGYSVDGGDAEYAKADPRFVGKLPKNLEMTAVAPVLCAGVTVYKGLKETGTKPGDWVVISGIGGLGHMAVQYAKAMGRHVVAVDIADEKLEFAKRLGADMTIIAANQDPADEIARTIGGAHGVLVTAVSRPAFAQALGIARRGGTVVLNGLPPGDFPVPIFDVVLKRVTLRGSIVGTRLDLQECLTFAAEGQVAANVAVEPL
ncbi:zinc-binding dehydrogenase [Algihabitans sp.]|uniref:zinc-binding dehydrogenase n=1 Tax=Algihabitans sp. TaxID=2821514 RepID=UPI003BAA9D64